MVTPGTITDSKLIVGLLAFIILVLVSAATARAQQGKSVEELVKSIGLSKPAITYAPDFNLRNASGGTGALSSYRGDWMLVNFWATWCEPCREEMPSMERLHRAFGGRGLTVLALNERESAVQVAKFLNANGLSFIALLDSNGRVAESFRVFGIPSTFLVGPGGQALGLKSGPKDWATRDVLEAMRQLVGAGGRGSTPAPVNFKPAAPLPERLRARPQGTIVYAGHDAQSDALVSLSANEEVIPLGKASAPGEFWYMVKSKNGVTGWVRGGDVEVGSGK
jgi:peroxiredoxin